MLREPGPEALEVLVRGLAPLDLAEGHETRQKHVLKVLLRGDVLGPEVGLDAEDMLFRPFGQAFKRFECRHLLEREEAADTDRLAVGVLALHVVEVAMGSGGI